MNADMLNVDKMSLTSLTKAYVSFEPYLTPILQAHNKYFI